MTYFIKIIIILIFLLGYFTKIQAQKTSKINPEKDTVKSFSFVPVPYVNYNRSTGFAGGLLPMAMYNLNRNDTVSPQSLSGLMGFYTTNNTWFVMAFSRFYFAENKWRINVAAGKGSINYQFYLSGPYDQFFDYNTGAEFAYIGFERKTIGDLYAGLNFMVSTTGTKLIDNDSINLIHNNYSYGISFSIDERSDEYYPKSGFISNLKINQNKEFGDKDNSSTKLELDYNHYFSIRKKHDVIAARLYSGIGLGDMNFTQQFVVGRTDIRGYSEGKYRANNILSIQGEYRWNFHKTLSAVGFLGVATVFDAINEEQNWKPLPGIGAGIRYNVFPKNHMNVGLDFATGIDDWGIYFKIGEAF